MLVELKASVKCKWSYGLYCGELWRRVDVVREVVDVR